MAKRVLSVANERPHLKSVANCMVFVVSGGVETGIVVGGGGVGAGVAAGGVGAVGSCGTAMWQLRHKSAVFVWHSPRMPRA